MMRDYRKGDELLLNCNSFGFASDVFDLVNCGKYKAKTFEADGHILCIMLYLQYVKDHYGVFSLVSQDVKPSHLKGLKRSIRKIAKDQGAKTFLTFCNKGDKLDRWHEFMGFVKGRNILTGRTQNMKRWVLKWE